MHVRAVVTRISLGSIFIKGLVTEYGIQYIGVPQIVDQFKLDNSQDSRRLRPLVSMGFSYVLLQTPLSLTPVNALSLEQFTLLIVQLVIRKNEQAIKLVEDSSVITQETITFFRKKLRK